MCALQSRMPASIVTVTFDANTSSCSCHLAVLCPAKSPVGRRFSDASDGPTGKKAGVKGAAPAAYNKISASFLGMHALGSLPACTFVPIVLRRYFIILLFYNCQAASHRDGDDPCHLFVVCVCCDHSQPAARAFHFISMVWRPQVRAEMHSINPP